MRVQKRPSLLSRNDGVEKVSCDGHLVDEGNPTNSQSTLSEAGSRRRTPPWPLENAYLDLFRIWDSKKILTIILRSFLRQVS